MPKTPAPSQPASTEAPLLELSVDRNEFLAEVQPATRVTEGKTTVPILTHLLLDARANSSVAITGSNLQRTLCTDCLAQVGATAKTSQDLNSSAQLRKGVVTDAPVLSLLYYHHVGQRFDDLHRSLATKRRTINFPVLQ
jgi:DNA polymerase III beta subunit, N-terminal domain